MTGLNFIATIHRLRAPGMTWFRLPLFIWSHYATSVILVLATPVLAVTLLMVAVERIFHVGIFSPALGGDPVLFQHMFWFYSHPAVYIMVLPGMAVVSELVAAFSRKPVFGYTFVAFASVSIAVIGFLVWGHHMFVAGQSIYSAMYFSILSYVVAVPSAIKVFNWTATIYKGSISWDTPMLYAIGFIGLFTIGGMTGLFLAALGHRRPCYRHLFRGRALSLHHGGRHGHGLPRAVCTTGGPRSAARCTRRASAKLSALTVFLGFNLTFFPQFVLGLPGDATAVCRLSTRIPIPAHPLDGGRHHPGRRLPDAPDLLLLVLALRAGRAAQSLAGHGVGMADSLAAPQPQLRDHSRGDPQGL